MGWPETPLDIFRRLWEGTIGFHWEHWCLLCPWIEGLDCQLIPNSQRTWSPEEGTYVWAWMQNEMLGWVTQLSHCSCVDSRSTTQVTLSMSPPLHIHKCGTGVGLELTVCSLEVQSSNHVYFFCCSTRLKYLELLLSLEHKRLARIPNTAHLLPRSGAFIVTQSLAGPSAIEETAEGHVTKMTKDLSPVLLKFCS